MTPRIVYRADVTINTTDEHKYYYGISDTLFKERYENHKTSFRHRSHLTASDLSKYYWKLVGKGAVPTIKFSIAKCVKGNTFITNWLSGNFRCFIVPKKETSFRHDLTKLRKLGSKQQLNF